VLICHIWTALRRDCSNLVRGFDTDRNFATTVLMRLGSAKVTIAPLARLNFPASSIVSSTSGTIALVECHLPMILHKAQFTNALPLADGGGVRPSPSAIPFACQQRAISFPLIQDDLLFFRIGFCSLMEHD
jgi:hypothetical protein